STEGCLALLDAAVGEEPPDLVLDIGTGTGILAIACLKLGAPRVLGLDIDPDAIAAARRNATVNDCADRLDLLLAGPELLQDRPPFPLVLANLLAHTHRALAPRYRRLVASGGQLILGGILEDEDAEVAEALEGTVLAREEAASESPCRLVLAQGIPKGEKMEGIIRMATELGVARIVPLATARAVVRMEPRRAAARVARWQRVAKEAAKQSGRGVIPEIAQPMSLGPWLAQGGPFGLLVCLWEGATEPLQPLLPPPPCPHATLVVR